jgi:hypothetical protein
MSILRRVISSISERIVAIVGGVISAKIETIALLEEVEQQNEIENAARQLEEEGKLQLAAELRERAERIHGDNPAAQGFRIIEQLQTAERPASLMLPSQPFDGEEEPAEEEPSPSTRKSFPRRHRRSTLHSPDATEPSSATANPPQ